MEGSFEYRNLLSQAMSDYNQKVSEAQEKFEAKNAIVEGIKASIERATDIPAGAFLTKPLETTLNVIGTEKGRTALKKGVKKVSDIIKNKLQKKKVDEAGEEETRENPAETEMEEIPQIEVEEEEPETLIKFSDFKRDISNKLKEMGEEDLADQYNPETATPDFLNANKETYQKVLDTLRSGDEDANEMADDLEEARSQFTQIQQQSTAEIATEPELRDQLAPMRDMMQRQQENFNRQQDPRGQDEPEANAQENAQATTQSDSAGATDSAGAEGGIGEGATEATTDAVAESANAAGTLGGAAAGAEAPALAGAEAGLDALGPVGWLVGLFLGIGTLVGGIEGANSVKNPSVPKPPHMASVATQFGIGQ
jgi:hypothetical protein